MERRIPDDIAPPITAPSLSSFIVSEPSMNLTGVPDEYDPLIPNEYEEFSKRRRDERRAEERKKEQAKYLLFLSDHIVTIKKDIFFTFFKF